jgi:hypothetical protein
MHTPMANLLPVRCGVEGGSKDKGAEKGGSKDCERTVDYANTYKK